MGGVCGREGIAGGGVGRSGGGAGRQPVPTLPEYSILGVGGSDEMWPCSRCFEAVVHRRGPAAFHDALILYSAHRPTAPSHTQRRTHTHKHACEVGVEGLADGILASEGLD